MSPTFSALRRLVPLLLASALLTSEALAQRDKGVWCGEHGNVGSCDGTVECDRLWAWHIREEHRSNGDGMADVVAASFSLMGTPAFVTIRAALIGGFVGALAGSLVMKEDETSQATAGAMLGAGLFLSGGAIKNRGAWPVVASLVLGAGGGALIGAGAGKTMEKSPEGSALLVEEQERTQNMAVAGAASGALLGFTLNVISKLRVGPEREWFGPDSRVRMLSQGERVGIRVSW